MAHLFGNIGIFGSCESRLGKRFNSKASVQRTILGFPFLRGTFTGSEALLLLMHAATMEFLESMSKSHERALFQGLQQEPYAALMGKEECGVANSLAQARDDFPFAR